MKNYLKTMTICTLLAALLLAGCGKGEEKPKDTMSGNQNPIQDIVDDIIESSPDEVGNYVTPAESCFVWESVDGGVKITSYTGTDTAIIVPATLGGEKVVAIAADAFNQVLLTGIKLPDSLTAIEKKTFYYCTTLMEVSLGAGTQFIGAQAFEGCVALTKVELCSVLTSIGEMAFGACQGLKQITLPESLNSIERGAFCMAGLESAVIPGSVTEIGEQAFASCYNIKNLEIHEGVTHISDSAFETCSALETARLPSSVEDIGYQVFGQCENVTVIAPAGSAAETYANENNIAFKAS